MTIGREGGREGGKRRRFRKKVGGRRRFRKKVGGKGKKGIKGKGRKRERELIISYNTFQSSVYTIVTLNELKY